MEAWINHLLTACGVCSGLLLATGDAGGGVALAIGAIAAAWVIRSHASTVREP
jgi:hypothetical protein